MVAATSWIFGVSYSYSGSFRFHREIAGKPDALHQAWLPCASAAGSPCQLENRRSYQPWSATAYLINYCELDWRSNSSLRDSNSAIRSLARGSRVFPAASVFSYLSCSSVSTAKSSSATSTATTPGAPPRPSATTTPRTARAASRPRVPSSAS